MKNVFWAAIAALMVWTIQVQAQVLSTPRVSSEALLHPKKFSANWRLSILGADRKDEDSQEKIVETRVDLRSRYVLTNDLVFQLDPTLRLESGQTQSYNGADKPENRIVLREASLSYNPASYMSLSAGALPQQRSHTRLLMDRLAFPSARLVLGPQKEDLRLMIFAESAIPTSNSMSTNTKELEPTPSLETLGLLTQIKSDFFDFKFGGNYYQFRNLPSAVAMDSRLLGNDVYRISDASYAFKYDYAGWEGLTSFGFWVLSQLKLSFEVEYLLNTQAPSDLNSAYSVLGAIEYNPTPDLGYELNSKYFHIEPEAAVSSFNVRRFETNRVGYQTEFYVNFKKHDFRLGLRFRESEVIYANTSQSREKMIALLLETFYADL
jgi:hypothetical protein